MRKNYRKNKEVRNAMSRQYRIDNKEAVEAATQKWREENREYLRQKGRERYEENKEEMKAQFRTPEARERINKRRKERWESDDVFRLVSVYRHRLWQAVRKPKQRQKEKVAEVSRMLSPRIQAVPGTAV